MQSIGGVGVRVPRGLTARASLMVSIVLMASLVVAGLVLFASLTQAQTDRTTLRLVKPGTAGAVDLSDYVTAKTILGGKLSTGSPAIIAWPGADDLNRALAFPDARFTFHDATGTIVIAKDGAPALSAITSDSMELMLVLDWNKAGAAGTAGDLGSATLGASGNFGFTADDKTLAIEGRIVASECIAGDCTNPAAGKLALGDEKSKLVPEAVRTFFGAEDLEGASMGQGVSFVGTTKLEDVVGDLATDEAGTLAVAVSGNVAMETGKFISSGTLDTSVKSSLRGSVEAENMALPDGLDAGTFVFSMNYEPAVAGNPGTDEKLTITAEGSVTIAALEAKDKDGKVIPAEVGVTVTITSTGDVSIGAKYDGGYTWTIPGTDTPLTVESLGLEMAVGEKPSIKASLSVELDGVTIFATIDVVEDTVNNRAVTTTTVSIGFREATLQQIANVAGSVAGTDIALPAELAKVKLSATAFFQVEGNDVSMWLDGTISIGTTEFGVGFFAEPGGGGLFSLKFSSSVTLGQLMPNAGLGDTFASIPLPTGGVVISDMQPFTGFVDGSPLPDVAQEFLAPIYGCADVNACKARKAKDQTIERGLKFFGNIKLPSLDNSLQALWIEPGSTFQVSGSLPIFGASESVSLTVKLPTIAPSTPAQIQSAPWFVGLDFAFTMEQDGANLSFSGSGKLTALIPDETDGDTLDVLLPNDPNRTQRGSSSDRFDLVSAMITAEFRVGVKEVSFTLTGTISGGDGQPWQSPFGVKWLSISAATIQLKIQAAPDPGVQLGVRFKAEIGGVLVDGSAAIKVGPGSPVKIGAGFRIYMDRLALQDVLTLAEAFGLNGVDPNDAPPLVFKNIELMFSTLDSEELCLAKGIVIGVDVYLAEAGSSDAESMGGSSATRPEATDATKCAGAKDRPSDCSDPCLGSGRLEILETGLLLDLKVRDLNFGPVKITQPKLLIEANKNTQAIEIRGGVAIDGFLEADGILKLSKDGMRVKVRVQDEDKTETFLIDASAAFDGPGGLPSAFSLEIEIVSETLGDISETVTGKFDDIADAFGAGDAVDVIRVTCMSLSVSVGQNESLESEDLVADGTSKTLPNGVHGDLHWVAFENSEDAALGRNGLPRKVKFTWDFDKTLKENLEGLVDIGTPVLDTGGSCGAVPDWDVFGLNIGPNVLTNPQFSEEQFGARHLNCHPTGRACPVVSDAVSFGVGTDQVSITNDGFPKHAFQVNDSGIATVPFRHLFNTPGFGTYYVRLEQVGLPVEANSNSYQKVAITLDGEVIGTEVNLDLKLVDNKPGLVQVRARVFDMTECDIVAISPNLLEVQPGTARLNGAQEQLEACTLNLLDENNRADAEGVTVSDRIFSVYLFDQPVSGPNIIESAQTVIFEGENFELRASHTQAAGLDPADYDMEFNLIASARNSMEVVFGSKDDAARRGEVETFQRFYAKEDSQGADGKDAEVEVVVELIDNSESAPSFGTLLGSEEVSITIANRVPYVSAVSIGTTDSATSESVRPTPIVPLKPNRLDRVTPNDWEALYAAPWSNPETITIHTSEVGNSAAGILQVGVTAWDPGLEDNLTVKILTSDGAETELDMDSLSAENALGEPERTGEHANTFSHQFAGGAIPTGAFDLTVFVIDDDGGQSAAFTRRIAIIDDNDAVELATQVLDTDGDGRFRAKGTTFEATDQSGAVSDGSLDAFGPSLSDQCVVWFTFDDPNNLPRLGNNFTEAQRNWFDIEVIGRSQNTWEPSTFAVTMPRGNTAGSANQAIQLFDIPFADGGGINPGVPTERFYSLGWVDDNNDEPVRVTFGVYTPGGCDDEGAASGPFEVLIEGRGPNNDFQFEGGFNGYHNLGASPVVLTEQVNLYANVEPGEPELRADFPETEPDSTVWYQFDSDYTYARYRVETTDTDSGLLGGLASLDTKLGVYVGPESGSESDFSGLVTLGANDDKSLTSDSRKSLVLADPGDTGIAEGDRLWVQVAGFNGGEGMFDLEVEALTSPPTADELGELPELILDVGSWDNGFNGSNVGAATHEMVYTAPYNGVLFLQVSGPGAGANALAVTELGDSFIGDLFRPVGEPQGETSWRAPVRGGQSYRITFFGSDGDFRFDAALERVDHDSADDAVPLEPDTAVNLRTGVVAGEQDNNGRSGSVRLARNSLDAAESISSREPGEPFHGGLTSTDHSVWASFDPTAGVTYEVFTSGADFDTVLAVYEGSDVENLVELAANDDVEGGSLESRVQFTSTSGAPVLIALAGYDHSWGAANLEVTEVADEGDGTPVGSVFTGVTPVRLFDTRTSAAPSGKVERGQTLSVQVAGVAGVPADATAVVLNVTGTEASRNGFVTVWPSGEARPLASSLNLVAGQTAPNMVLVPIGDDGKVSFFSSGGTHLLGDVAGFFTPVSSEVSAGRLVPVSPKRLFDTRSAVAPVGKVERGSTLVVQVAGEAGVPSAGVSAVVMNLTGTGADSAGFVTAFPSGTRRPLASVLNMERAGHTAANLVIVPIGADGKVSVFSSTGLHLLADVVGYITDETAAASTQGLFVPVTPARVYDTRSAAAPNGLVDRGETIEVAHSDTAGIPASGVAAVSINVTATQSVRPGFITAFPTGDRRPLASVLNLTQAGETRPNAAILPLGDDGQVSFFASGGAHLLADANGYFTN